MKRILKFFLLPALAALSLVACQKTHVDRGDGDPDGPANGKVKIMMAASADHSLILKADGTVWGCGSNKYNKFGIEGNVSSLSRYTKIFDDAIFIAVGVEQSVVIKKDYTLWAAGRSHGYLLGKKFEERDGVYWTKIADDVKYVSVGLWASMIIKRDNSLWIAGTNYEGALGMGYDEEETQLQEYTKVDDDVAECSISGFASIYLKKDGTAYVAGENAAGALGLGDFDNVNKFTKITKIRGGVKAVGTSYGTASALILDNPESSLFMAGSQRVGQLGIGNPRIGESMWMWSWSPRAEDDQTGPPQAGGDPDDWPDEICITPYFRHVRDHVKKVSLGGLHTMILTNKNNLYACGGWERYNYTYALGADGKSHYYPVKVASNVVDVFASASGTTILKEDGSMWAASNWNTYLTGDGRTEANPTPNFERIVLP